MGTKEPEAWEICESLGIYYPDCCLTEKMKKSRDEKRKREEEKQKHREKIERQQKKIAEIDNDILKFKQAYEQSDLKKKIQRKIEKNRKRLQKLLSEKKIVVDENLINYFAFIMIAYSISLDSLSSDLDVAIKQQEKYTQEVDLTTKNWEEKKRQYDNWKADVSDRIESELCIIEKNLNKYDFRNNDIFTNDESIAILNNILNIIKDYDSLLSKLKSKVWDDESQRLVYCSDYLPFIYLEDDIQRQLSILQAGKKGENNVADVLKLYKDDMHVFNNYRFWQGEYAVEIDDLVVSKNGIFSIEIKNWSEDCLINEAGFLTRKNSKDSKPKNIAFQSEQHIRNLQAMLKNSNVNIPQNNFYEVLCFANPKANVDNKFPYISWCYTNEIGRLLMDTDKYPNVFSDDEVNAICEYIEKQRIEDGKYPLKITEDVKIDNTFFDGLLSDFRKLLYVTDDNFRKEPKPLDSEIAKIEKPYSFDDDMKLFLSYHKTSDNEKTGFGTKLLLGTLAGVAVLIALLDD